MARRGAPPLLLALSTLALAGCGGSKPVTNLKPEATFRAGGSVKSVSWSHEGSLAAGAGSSVVVWKGNKKAWQARHGREVWGVAWPPDGKRVASGNGDGTVRVWRVG